MSERWVGGRVRGWCPGPRRPPPVLSAGSPSFPLPPPCPWPPDLSDTARQPLLHPLPFPPPPRQPPSTLTTTSARRQPHSPRATASASDEMLRSGFASAASVPARPPLIPQPPCVAGPLAHSQSGQAIREQTPSGHTLGTQNPGMHDMRGKKSRRTLKAHTWGSRSAHRRCWTEHAKRPPPQSRRAGCTHVRNPGCFVAGERAREARYECMPRVHAPRHVPSACPE